MAFILVFKLHKSKAYSFDECQIVLLHVHGKPTQSKAAMQALHGAWQNFVIFIRAFWRPRQPVSAF
jgi:hypothetical protein